MTMGWKSEILKCKSILKDKCQNEEMTTWTKSCLKRIDEAEIDEIQDHSLHSSITRNREYITWLVKVFVCFLELISAKILQIVLIFSSFM